MKIIQFAALFTLLSVSFPLAQASESSNTNKDVIQKQEDDAINPVLTTSSSSNFLRGAANLAWDLLVVSDRNGNGNEEDVMLTSCALWSSCPSDYPYCKDDNCCADSCSGTCTPQSCYTSTTATESYDNDSVEKDDADAGEDVKTSFRM